MWRARLQERKALALLAEWDAGEKNIPLHMKIFFFPVSKACQVQEALYVPAYFMPKRSYRHRSQKKLCPFERLTSKHLGQLAPYKLPLQNECHTNMDNIFRETCRHLEELGWEWLQCVDMGGPEEAVLTQLLILGHNTCLSCGVKRYCASEVLVLYTPPRTGLLQAEPMGQCW